MQAVNTDTVLAVRAGRMFDGQRCFGPVTVLIDAGHIVDIDTTGATPARAEVSSQGRSRRCNGRWAPSSRW